MCEPIAFQGEVTASDRPAADVFRTRVGEGFTGRVVETGESLLLADASKCEFSITIEGTERIDESVIAVPLNYGARVIGAIVGAVMKETRGRADGGAGARPACHQQGEERRRTGRQAEERSRRPLRNSDEAGLQTAGFCASAHAYTRCDASRLQTIWNDRLSIVTL